jgi:hypothetical protein
MTGISVETALAIAGAVITALFWLFQLRSDVRRANERHSEFVRRYEREQRQMRDDFNVAIGRASQDPYRSRRLRPLSRAGELQEEYEP